MPENPFLLKIRKLAQEVMAEDIDAMVNKIVDERIEKHLDETVPAIVTTELHKMLDGGEIKQRRKFADPDEENDAGGAAGGSIQDAPRAPGKR